MQNYYQSFRYNFLWQGKSVELILFIQERGAINMYVSCLSAKVQECHLHVYFCTSRRGTKIFIGVNKVRKKGKYS